MKDNFRRGALNREIETKAEIFPEGTRVVADKDSVTEDNEEIWVVANSAIEALKMQTFIVDFYEVDWDE